MSDTVICTTQLYYYQVVKPVDSVLVGVERRLW